MSAETVIYSIDLPRPTYPFLPDEIPTDEPVSVHVVAGDETVLFGAGYAVGAATLIREFGRDGGPDVLVVEHAHPDHYDAVPILRELYDDLTVAIPEDDVAALQEAGIDPDLRLRHDDEIGGTRAIHLPGHTPGNMSFLHEATGILFAGDTFVHSTSPNAAPGEWSGPFAPMKPVLSDDDEQARRSIRSLAEYDVESAYLTHGPNVSDAAPALKTLVDDLASFR